MAGPGNFEVRYKRRTLPLDPAEATADFAGRRKKPGYAAEDAEIRVRDRVSSGNGRRLYGVRSELAEAALSLKISRGPCSKCDDSKTELRAADTRKDEAANADTKWLVAAIGRKARGFVYTVSVTGTTGGESMSTMS